MTEEDETRERDRVWMLDAHLNDFNKFDRRLNNRKPSLDELDEDTGDQDYEE